MTHKKLGSLVVLKLAFVGFLVPFVEFCRSSTIKLDELLNEVSEYRSWSISVLVISGTVEIKNGLLGLGMKIVYDGVTEGCQFRNGGD